MDDKLKFQIKGFHKFDNGIDDNDCVAFMEDGTEIRVDPFVGCAYKYENREQLIGNWYEAEGHWHENSKHNCPKCFLPREGCFKLLTVPERCN